MESRGSNSETRQDHSHQPGFCGPFGFFGNATVQFFPFYGRTMKKQASTNLSFIHSSGFFWFRGTLCALSALAAAGCQVCEVIQAGVILEVTLRAARVYKLRLCWKVVVSFVTALSTRPARLLNSKEVKVQKVVQVYKGTFRRSQGPHRAIFDCRRVELARRRCCGPFDHGDTVPGSGSPIRLWCGRSNHWW